MARNKKIDDDDILDAAERVVVKGGAAGLSIDAVAREAGISKSRVVYNYGSKSGLLEALIQRRVTSEQRKIEEAVASCKDTPHPALFGRVAAAAAVPDHTERAVMLAISAAMSNEEKFQKQLRDWISEELVAIEQGTDRPRAALMTYLAMLGFCHLDYSESHSWDAGERRRALDDILKIFTSFREPA